MRNQPSGEKASALRSGILVIAGEDVGPAGLDLALARVWARIGDAEGHARRGDARRMQPDLARLVAGEQRRRLGEAVADRVGETRMVQEGLDVGGEGGPADAEKAELAAEGLLELEAGHPLEGRPQDRDLVERDLFEGGLDARAVDLLDDEGDREHQRRPDGHEGGKEGRSRGRPVEVIDCGAVHDGDEKADRELVGVGEGQDGEEAVRPPEQGEGRRRPSVVDEVAMSEHDAFGLAHRAGRIEDGSQFVRLDRRRREETRALSTARARPAAPAASTPATGASLVPEGTASTLKSSRETRIRFSPSPGILAAKRLETMRTLLSECSRIVDICSLRKSVMMGTAIAPERTMPK